MKWVTIVSVMLLMASAEWACAHPGHVADSLLRVLDGEIERFETYEQAKERSLAHLRREYLSLPPDTFDRYLLGKRLFEEYLRYNYDSAHHYLVACIAWADARGEPGMALRDRLTLAYLYACTGSYAEAYMGMQQVRRAEVETSGLQALYYQSYRKLYEELRFQASDPISRQRFGQLQEAYADSLAGYLESSMDEYWYARMSALYDAGREDACLALLADYPADTRKHALLCYLMACNYDESGREDEAVAYYARATIADIRSCTRDHGALPVLSLHLLERHNVKRADRYIRFSSRQVSQFNGKLRQINLAPVFAVTERVNQQMITRNQHVLQVLSAVISVLLVVLIFLLRIVLRQLRRTSNRKDGLKRSNRRLRELNDNTRYQNECLRQDNEKLVTSDTIKGKYIMHFIRLCAAHIDSMDDYRLKIRKLATSGDMKSIARLTGAPDAFSEGVERLYSSFDEAFLHIYPDFVASFNALLQDDKQFVLKKGERLTTELRIFALMKLGITDYNQIASLLKCSVNTVYNYRTRVKGKLKVSKEEFDAFFGRE